MRDFALATLAAQLTAMGGAWSVVDRRVQGPANTAVILGDRHSEDQANHIDIGFVLDTSADEPEVIWDCVAGLGDTQADALENAMFIWTQVTAPTIVEFLTQRHDFATHYGPEDPEGVPGFHVLHGPVLAYGRGNPTALQEWALQNSLLSVLAPTLAPHLDRAGLNAAKLMFGGVAGDEVVEVRVNGEVRAEPTRALAEAGWPRLDQPAFARIFLLAHDDSTSE